MISVLSGKPLRRALAGIGCGHQGIAGTGGVIIVHNVNCIIKRPFECTLLSFHPHFHRRELEHAAAAATPSAGCNNMLTMALHARTRTATLFFAISLAVNLPGNASKQKEGERKQICSKLRIVPSCSTFVEAW